MAALLQSIALPKQTGRSPDSSHRPQLVFPSIFCSVTLSFVRDYSGGAVPLTKKLKIKNENQISPQCSREWNSIHFQSLKSNCALQHNRAAQGRQSLTEICFVKLAEELFAKVK